MWCWDGEGDEEESKRGCIAVGKKEAEGRERLVVIRGRKRDARAVRLS